MKKILFLLTVILFLGQLSFAQTTISTATGTTGYTGVNGVSGNSAITFVVENTNSSAIILDAIENFKGTSLASPATFSLWYSTTSISGAPTITTPDWILINTTNSLTLNAGYNTIFSGLGFTIPAGAEYRFAIQSNNGISYSGSAAGNCTPSTLSDGGVNLILGDAQIGGSYVGYAGAFPSPGNNPRWFTGSITFFPAVPCTAPPVAGSATSSSALGCAGTPFTLDVSGASQGTGLSFQWDSSYNGTTWFPIIGAISKTYTNIQVSTSYYRCGVTCSGNRANSTPVLVTTPALVSGNFTINSGIATGGTNFQTFADAINYVSCGINGPVVFNVAPNSGPYDEQVSIPQIGGTSATNTITIKGNGQTLGSANASTTSRGILTLNGADYVTIDSLVIDATQGTFAWGILLMGRADNNTIRKCVINCNATATTTNFIGIVINGSNSAVAINGDNGNNNTISENEINGGYYSVYVYGNTTSTSLNNNNVVSKNVFKDFYGYCVNAISQSSGLVVSGNEISRPNRTNSGATAGVFLGAGCIGALVEKNRIHNMFDGFVTGTSIFYGVYVATDSKPGQEVKVINNLIYNINGNGAQYGIYNNGGDSMQAYHNTIVLDDAATTTGATYGFYQTVLANKIDFRNNIIFLTRSGTGAKRCIALITATSDVSVNNNSLYFNPTSGITNFFGQFGTATFATFAIWQTANNNVYDQQSIDGDPFFVSASTGDFTPSNPNINDIGANLGVTKDINGDVRSSNPDPGAIEFTIPPCTNPPTTGTIVAVSYICPNTIFSLNLTGNSYGSSQTYSWEKSVNGTTGWIAVGVPSTNPQILTSQTASFYYRCGVKCGTGAIVYTLVQLITSPSLVAGTYTINSI